MTMRDARDALCGFLTGAVIFGPIILLAWLASAGHL